MVATTCADGAVENHPGTASEDDGEIVEWNEAAEEIRSGAIADRSRSPSGRLDERTRANRSAPASCRSPGRRRVPSWFSGAGEYRPGFRAPASTVRA
ncbi:hypothetical protein, partial [Halovivax sp.]|uniref:hypothetical protein n=1 Tax=Halovivax sp. TaxID=1935978 RepID=UPI0025BB8420